MLGKTTKSFHINHLRFSTIRPEALLRPQLGDQHCNLSSPTVEQSYASASQRSPKLAGPEPVETARLFTTSD